MKKIEFEKLENIEGGLRWRPSLAQSICGVGFIGYTGIIGYGLAFAPVTAGASVLILGGISLIGAGVCGLVPAETPTGEFKDRLNPVI